MISAFSFSLTNLDTVSWESPLLLVITRKEQGKLLACVMRTRYFFASDKSKVYYKSIETTGKRQRII